MDQNGEAADRLGRHGDVLQHFIDSTQSTREHEGRGSSQIGTAGFLDGIMSQRELSDFLRIYIMNETSNKQKEDLKIEESVQLRVAVMARYHLKPGRRTLPPAKGFRDLEERKGLQSLISSTSNITNFLCADGSPGWKVSQLFCQSPRFLRRQKFRISDLHSKRFPKFSPLVLAFGVFCHPSITPGGDSDSTIMKQTLCRQKKEQDKPSTKGKNRTGMEPNNFGEDSGTVITFNPQKLI
ncbi:hypothetical protein BTVI_08309 [Pitangus sulphuratus]|nr:hypothetical protein BTVI_08309 [Pitangus sulphuratus]